MSAYGTTLLFADGGVSAAIRVWTDWIEDRDGPKLDVIWTTRDFRSSSNGDVRSCPTVLSSTVC
jgi:hypothetical protein